MSLTYRRDIIRTLYTDKLMKSPAQYDTVQRWHTLEKEWFERTIHPEIYDAMIARFKERFPQYVRQKAETQPAIP